MARCAGKTQSGARCKRDALEGSDYCTLHQDQAGDATGAASDEGEGGATGGRESYRSPASDAAIVLGVAAVTWAVLRRFFRIF